MKKTLIWMSMALLLLSLTGCMRGGNADRGNDGYLGVDDVRDEQVADDIRNGIRDARDDIKDGVEKALPDRNDGYVESMPSVDDGQKGRIDGYRGRWEHKDDEAPSRAHNDSGNISNFGGGLNGSGLTGNGTILEGETRPEIIR